MAQEYTDEEDGHWFDSLEKARKKEAKNKKQRETTDCRTEEGITVGLIDSMITIGRVLKNRIVVMSKTPAIEEALKDLNSDEDLKFIMGNKSKNS